MYLAEHRMVDFVGLVPLAGTLGYGVAIVSYNQSLYFGAMAEPRLMPDVEFMKSPGHTAPSPAGRPPAVCLHRDP
jgi:WS/DGAT C-terminal domain